MARFIRQNLKCFYVHNGDEILFLLFCLNASEYFILYEVFPSTQKVVSNILPIPPVEFTSFKKCLSCLSKQVLVIKNVDVWPVELCKHL